MQQINLKFKYKLKIIKNIKRKHKNKPLSPWIKQTFLRLDMTLKSSIKEQIDMLYFIKP